MQVCVCVGGRRKGRIEVEEVKEVQVEVEDGRTKSYFFILYYRQALSSRERERERDREREREKKLQHT